VIAEWERALIDALWDDMQARAATWRRVVAAWAAQPRPPRPAPTYPQGVDIEVP